MATVIDELMVKLGLDGSAAKSGMSEVENSISGGVSNIKNMLSGLAVAFAGIFSAQQAFSTYLETADSMMKFSRSIGQNIEDMHAWGEAVTRSGGSMESFQGSVKTLTTQLSKMSTIGMSRAGNILQSVGIDAGEVGRQRDALEVMKDVAGVMEGMSKAEAMGFGQSLGLDAGTIMLLQSGRDGVAQLVDKQKRLGTINKESAEAAEAFNDAIADTKQAFLALSANIFGAAVPALQYIVELVTEFVSYLQKHSTAVKAFFIMIGVLVAGYLLPTFLSFFAALLTNPITWIVLALAGLALVIEDLVVWAEGGESALGDLWAAMFGSPEEAAALWEEIKQAAMDCINWIKENWDTIITILTLANPFLNIASHWKQIKAVATTVIRFIRENWTALMTVMQTLFPGFAIISHWQEIGNFARETMAGIQENWNAFSDGISAAWQTVSDFVTSVWSGAVSIVTGLIDGILAVANAVFNGIIGLINSVASAFYNIFGGAIEWAKGKLAELRAGITSLPVVGGALNSALDAMGWSGGNTYNNGGNTTDTRIGQVNVYTQATDAGGIASDMGSALNNQFSYQADGAY